MEKLIDTLLSAMDENSFMVDHEKKKVKEITKTIKQLEKVNEKIENKVDLQPYVEEREEHLTNYNEYKQEQRKLNRIFKILTDSKEVNEVKEEIEE